MPIQVFPFNGGIQGQIDTRLLPDGALSDAVNCQLDREGRLVGRAGFTAIGTGVLSAGAGALVAYDLFTLGERLFAVGDDTRLGVPANHYEYLGSGVANPWRPTSPVADLLPRLPLATRVRDILRPPDQPDGISCMAGAAFAGFACLAWNNSLDTTLGYLLVSRAANNQPVHLAQLSQASNRPSKFLRLVGLSDRVIIVGVNTAGNAVSISSFTPATDNAVVDLAQSVLSGVGVGTLAVCKVAGADQFMIVVNLNGTIRTRRYTNAGVVVVPSGGQYADVAVGASALAVEASSVANQVTIAMVVSGETRLFSFNLTTGASIGVGPFVPFTGDTSVEVSLVRVSGGLQVVSSISSGSTPTIKTNFYTVATNTFAGAIVAVTDAQLTTSAGFASSGQLLFGMRVGLATVGNTPNLLASWALTNTGNRIEIAKDLETAGTESVCLPDLVQDSSTGKWYWVNAAANPDGSLLPMLTEFSFGSTERRQSCELGGRRYFGGGCPYVFDGFTAVESGYQERPRIISLTGSVGAGLLLASAEYDYRLHQEWIDTNGDLHLSPPSAITSITLGSTHHTVTAVCSTPHSNRRNVGAAPGTGVCDVLSRTLATAVTEPAVITGTALIDPPAGALTGLQLSMNSNGPGTFTCTFSAGAVDAATIVAEINTAFGAGITASAPNGVLVLTSLSEGETAYLQIYTGDANTLLGVTAGTIVNGTTTRSKGENFQRTATRYTLASDAVAARLSITDLTKDQSDPIVDTDLIRQQVLYSSGIASGAHHAPPPADYVWAGRERVHYSGQPKRNRSTASKLVVPGEPAEFAFEGFLAFQSQVSGDIEASAVLGDSVIHWTRNEIWEVTGSGPGRNGQGEFFAARCISRAGGIVADGWRSLCETDDGVFFQRKSDQLCFLSKAGIVEWIGKAVQEYLLLYPVITSAVYVSTKHSVAFGLSNVAGNAGGILRYDLDAKAWFFDNVGAVVSLAVYQGRLVYLQAGVVYLEDASPGLGTFVGYYARTGMFQGFQGLGYGQVNQIGFLGTFRDDCTVTIKRSANGTTYPETLAVFTLTTAQYAVGQRVTLLKDPNPSMQDSFALEYSVASASPDSEGIWLHAAALDTTAAPKFTRLGPANKL
jgi:hypothetical protein